ncbi:hypothetical protein BKA62DRAFT_698020 [Auriculariales sp. MPI-PUGE-AT-0066]|nr:hypothetical protein BKA62DRAFT_698020 [Auriculariales sp. MPI-PUGE-AT-0066]
MNSTATAPSSSPPATTPPGVETDSRKKKHLCPTCNRGFTTSGHLSRHQRVHSGERNHACPFPGCTTRCSRQDNLQQHYRVHLSPRSRNISTSAARQAMAKKQNELSSGIIDTGTSTPPPMPDDSGRSSPPAPASLAYRAQQLHDDRGRDNSPPQPVMNANMPAPGVTGQPFANYVPGRESAGPNRITAPWPAGSHQYHAADRGRDVYQHSPTSPISPHSHSPTMQRGIDMVRAHQSQHTRQYSSSSTGSLGSLRDASGSDVSLPSFMDSGGPPPHQHYNTHPGGSYVHQPNTPHSGRGTSPPPILPPIFTNRAPYGQPLPSHAPAPHVYNAHLHGGH